MKVVHGDSSLQEANKKTHIFMTRWNDASSREPLRFRTSVNSVWHVSQSCIIGTLLSSLTHGGCCRWSRTYSSFRITWCSSRIVVGVYIVCALISVWRLVSFILSFDVLSIEFGLLHCECKLSLLTIFTFRPYFFYFDIF